MREGSSTGVGAWLTRSHNTKTREARWRTLLLSHSRMWTNKWWCHPFKSQKCSQSLVFVFHFLFVQVLFISVINCKSSVFWFWLFCRVVRYCHHFNKSVSILLLLRVWSCNNFLWAKIRFYKILGCEPYWSPRSNLQIHWIFFEQIIFNTFLRHFVRFFPQSCLYCRDVWKAENDNCNVLM